MRVCVGESSETMAQKSVEFSAAEMINIKLVKLNASQTHSQTNAAPQSLSLCVRVFFFSILILYVLYMYVLYMLNCSIHCEEFNKTILLLFK